MRRTTMSQKAPLEARARPAPPRFTVNLVGQASATLVFPISSSPASIPALPGRRRCRF